MLERDLAIFDFLEMPERFHLGHDGATSHQPVQTLPFPAVFVQGPVRIQKIDRLAHRLLIAGPAGVVVGVMCRCHFHAARTECLIGQQRIGNDWDQTPVHRDLHPFANQMCVTFVGGMNANGGIPEHRFGSRGTERNPFPGRLSRLVDHRIVHRPEVAVDLFLIDFVVRNGGLQKRIPIHQPLATIDQTVFEHLEERLPYGARTDFVQREPHPPPVTACPNALQLAENPFLVRIFPGPDPLHQGFAADVVASQSLFLEHPFFHDRLRGNPRMIGPWHPQGFIPLHPPPTRQQILQCAVECMPHVQGSRHIWQRNHNDMWGFGVRITRLGSIRIKVTTRLPIRKPAGFSGGGVILLGDFSRHISSRCRVGNRGSHLTGVTGPVGKKRLRWRC